MKKGGINIVLLTVILGFSVIILLITQRLKVIKVPVEVPVEVPVKVPIEVPVERSPEYREPPIKQYKPGYIQQMGVLMSDDGSSTLPLYGKEVRGRRDRYHYYTSTSGDQIYPLPVSMGDRDCMDDIGCQELYGNESITVLGKNDLYQAKLYRTDNYF